MEASCNSAGWLEKIKYDQSNDRISQEISVMMLVDPAVLVSHPRCIDEARLGLIYTPDLRLGTPHSQCTQAFLPQGGVRFRYGCMTVFRLVANYLLERCCTP